MNVLFVAQAARTAASAPLHIPINRTDKNHFICFVLLFKYFMVQNLYRMISKKVSRQNRSMDCSKVNKANISEITRKNNIKSVLQNKKK